MPAAARALQIQGHLRRLKDLNIGSEILRLHGAGIYDLELIAAAEDELRALDVDEHVDETGVSEK